MTEMNHAPAGGPSGLIRLLDWSMLLFLYLNVLVPTLLLGHVAVSKGAFAFMLAVFGLVLWRKRERIHRRALFYILVAFAGMGFLGLASLAMGNEPASILELARIPLIALIIMPLTVLFRHFGMERYIQHLTWATLLLATIYLALVFLIGPLGCREIATYIQNSGTSFAQTLTIAFFPGGIRITTTNQGFLSAAAVLTYIQLLRRRGWHNLAAFLICMLALRYCYTVSLWASTAFGLACCLLLPVSRTAQPSLVRRGLCFSRVRLLKIALVGGGLMGLALTAIYLPGFILESKSESFSFKRLQLAEAVTAFREAPLLGRGLGFIYRRGEFHYVSGEASSLLENSYAVILASTGLAGCVVFALIYLYYPVAALCSRQISLMMAVLLLLHLMVLIQAWGNPFLWSGGLGLLFACFLGASLDHTSSSAAPFPRAVAI